MFVRWKSLDWKTRERDVRLKSHWRVSLCVFVGVLIAAFAWFWRTPHAFWFMILWVALATGSFAGLLPGVAWQLHNHERWPETSGWFIVASFFGFGLAALVGVLLLAPGLYNEEVMRLKFRSLAANDILALDVNVKGAHFHQGEGAPAITAFVAAAKEAQLFYRSHEGGVVEFALTVEFKNGPAVSCEGNVPERHMSDIALKCPGALAGELLIPGGRRWLDETTGTQA